MSANATAMAKDEKGAETCLGLPDPVFLDTIGMLTVKDAAATVRLRLQQLQLEKLLPQEPC